MKAKMEIMNTEIESIVQKYMTNIILESDSICAKALKEIQEVIKRGNIVDGDKSDFDIVEDIVCIFEKYEIDTGGCHDF